MSPAAGESAMYPRVENFLTGVWGVLQAEAAANVFSAGFDRTDTTGLTTVSMKRPDVCVYARTKPVLILKGELKDRADELSKAVDELVKKMTGWNPHLLAGLPFLPCFVWAGSTFQWAMLRGKATATTAEVVLSPESINLSGQAGCVRLLQESMNMLTVLSYLGNVASPHVRLPLFRWVHRINGNSFRVQVDHVEKICKPAPMKVYELLQSDVTGAVCVKVIHVRKDGRVMLHVSPVCMEAQPNTEAELKLALRSVLTALSAFHTEGLVHRDIRWENVLRSGSNIWRLADFEEADQADRILDLSSRNNAGAFLPNEVLEGKPYTAKADVWAVGNLLKMWTESHPEVVLSAEGKDFMDLLLKETPEERPTARGTLDAGWLKV
jgi:hypothetical protein